MMPPKQPPDSVWFNQIPLTSFQTDYIWLLELGIQADNIADFGCWHGYEVLTLLWLFGASEITVVEKEDKHIDELKELERKTRTDTPERLEGRTIKSIRADISLPIPQLPSDYFDLAFCDNVLYNLKEGQQDFEKVQSAINQMARVVRPDGWVAAYEPKMGVEFEERDSIIRGMTVPVPLNAPNDISHMFMEAGLVKSSVDLDIPYAYVFRKSVADL